MTPELQDALNQLADYFETLASDQEASVRWQTKKRDKEDCVLRAQVWRDAASELRTAKFTD